MLQDIKCPRTWLAGIASAILLLAIPAGRASADPAPAIMIDIDNPRFRKLVVAAPAFEAGTPGDAEVARLAREGAGELRRLLDFSGYFQIIEEAAFRDILAHPPTDIKTSLPGFEGMNLPQWKAIGVESLTLGKVSRLPDRKLRLELRSADVHKGERLLGKAYTFNSADEMETRIKRYVDRLLMRYTGKPGIFSSRIVLIGRRTKGSDKQVYTCDVDGRNLTQLTFAKSPHLSPSWSPDGKRVLFTSYREGKPDLYMIELATNTVSKIAGYKGINSGGVFSPNSQVIAFTGSVSGGNTEIFLTSPGEGARRSFLQGEGIDVDPAFSPDGKWLAFVSGRFGNPHIFRAQLEWSADGKQVKAVDDKRLTYAGWYNATPAWSPDNGKLAFAGFDKDISRFDLFLMNPDGTKLERLTIHAADNESPSWSPNGQLIMFHSNRVGSTDVKGVSQLYIMNRDGSNQRLIPTGLYDAQTPKWGPNLLDD